MTGTITSMLSAVTIPAATPTAVPNMPITTPCTMKIFMMLPGEAPSVRRIAMSGCLSVTTITRVETRLNAATAMMSVRMMNIMRFSIWIARK